MKPRGVGFLILGALGGAAVAGWRRDRARESGATQVEKAKTPAPPIFAYIYRKPGELAVRMSSGTSPKTAREMFVGSQAGAEGVAASKGWRLAWQGVRDL